MLLLLLPFYIANTLCETTSDLLLLLLSFHIVNALDGSVLNIIGPAAVAVLHCGRSLRLAAATAVAVHI